jgi:DNA-binding transcriptional MerR regulator
LLGATPKAIRHYEKLGLLDGPERSESGYRLYTASDLLRLYRIRKLRSLGLPLREIGNVLGDGDPGVELKRTLETILGEVESQIGHLEKRRADLLQTLGDSATDYSEVPLAGDEPYAFAIFREHLGERWKALDSRMLEQTREFWGTLDAFEWPQGYTELQEKLARYMAEHPGDCEKILELEERLAALAHLSEDSNEVEILAEDYAVFFVQSTFFEEVLEQTSAVDNSMEGLEQVFSGVALGAMYPAQKRCMELLIERLSPRDTR